jgi:murein DD-endopeptidase MepM/ murein hydrolase activator NlpD
VSLPVLIGIGAAWKAKSEVASLYSSNRSLEAENANYRGATEALSDQIESLQSVVADLGARSALDPALARSVEKLPAFVKSRAMGGAQAAPFAQQAAKTFSALAVPEDTFGLLRNVLEGLQSRLSDGAIWSSGEMLLPAATPSIWPAQGWITSRMGSRQDPMTGGEDFHAGLDIAGEKGQPIYATAAGRVTQADYQGRLRESRGRRPRPSGSKRSTATSRRSQSSPDRRSNAATSSGVSAPPGAPPGYHLHYEVRANGRLLNPLQLLTKQKPRDQ